MITNKREAKLGTVIILSCLLFLFAQAQIIPQPFSKEPAKPVAPTIAITPDYFYPPEEALYIEGRSEPSAIVTVILQKQGENPIKFTIQADALGEWVVAEKTFLKSGNWEVRARSQIGAEVSEWSNPRVIRSIVTGLNFLGVNVRYITLAAVGLLMLVGFILLYIYFFRRVQRFNLARIRELRSVLFRHQITETEDRLHRGIAEIRKDLTEELQELTNNAQERSLTPKEVQRREHILRELEELEKDLSHEISDIGK